MRIVSTLFLAIVLLAASLTATASTAKIGSRGERVPVTSITTLLSEPGESKDAFVMRAGIWFRNFTTTSGYEACGLLAQSPTGQYGLVISTSNSQIACLIPATVPPGFTKSGDTVHSHPVVARMEINANDRAFMQAGRQTSQRVPQRMRASVDPRRFSDPDMEAGPGYLVTDGKVLYQHGPRTTREVGVLPPLDRVALGLDPDPAN